MNEIETLVSKATKLGITPADMHGMSEKELKARVEAMLKFLEGLKTR